MVFDRLIIIEKQDPETEAWTIYAAVHAHINKNGGGEKLSAGAERTKQSLSFEMRYSQKVAEVRYNTTLYRIDYNGHYYNITDFDLFNEDIRNNIKLVGELYGKG